MKDTGHIVECGDIQTAIGDATLRMEILTALDILLRQGTLLKPEYVILFTMSSLSLAMYGCLIPSVL